MKKFTLALLFSVLTAVCLGAITVQSGSAPTLALSYGASPARIPLRTRLLSLSVPTLSPSPQSAADATEVSAEPEIKPNSERSIPIFYETDTSVISPQNPGNANRIVTKTYASSLSVNNSSPKIIDVDELLEHVPNLDFSGNGPQILIVHTHTTESYNDTAQDWYGSEDTRNDDPSRNMVRMGEILEQTLTECGYSVIHCQTVHDEDFNASYTKSNRSVREYLEKYPSIAVVIDLHRDSLIDAAGTKYRPVTEIEGEAVAQVMLLMGVGNDTYPHPNWKENLSLALRIQQQAQDLYPGLMRPILVRPSRYNQYLSNGAILLELGSCGNTPDEAERAAKYFGTVCAAALDKIRNDAQ